MPKNFNILLIYGGHEEAEISKVSAHFLASELNQIKSINLFIAYLGENQDLYEAQFENNQLECLKNTVSINRGTLEITDGTEVKINYAIPCIHGRPGESGDLQPLLEFNQIRYLGNGREQSTICFNKITTKLWAECLGVKTVPFEMVNKDNYKKRLDHCLDKLGENLFVKTTSQGSSIGCYPAKGKEDLVNSIKNCLKYGETVLIEKAVKAREIEVAVFNFENNIIVSNPGEVLTSTNFYSFEEKYSKESKTAISTSPENISDEMLQKIKDYSKALFVGLHLKDLARVDFFLTEDGLFLNEINTFPGMTPISLFPQLVEVSGIKFTDYLNDRIISGAKNA